MGPFVGGLPGAEVRDSVSFSAVERDTDTTAVELRLPTECDD
jgi:hypothetical protein